MQESLAATRASLEHQLAEVRSNLIAARRRHQARELELTNEIARMRSDVAAPRKDFKMVAQTVCLRMQKDKLESENRELKDKLTWMEEGAEGGEEEEGGDGGDDGVGDGHISNAETNAEGVCNGKEGGLLKSSEG